MREIHFTLVGEAARRLRLERLPRRPHRGWLALLLAGIVIALARAGGSGPGDAPSRRAVINSIEVRANRVIVLLDDSGSMSGTDGTVQLQLNRLAAAGIALDDRSTVPGFAIAESASWNLMPKLLERLEAKPLADTIYVVSDFSAGDDEGNDPAAIAALRRTLRDRNIRLYFATVRDRPPPVYVDIARTSGGDVIPVK